MAAQGADLQQILKTLETFLHASDVKRSGEELVKAFRTLVVTYAAIKTDTEADRANYAQQCTEALRNMWKAINARLDELKDGHTPTNDELLALILPLIPEPVHGETPDDARLLALIKPLIPIVKDGSPDSAEDIRNKLEVLPEGERLSMDAIEGLRQAIEDLSRRIMYSMGGGGNGGGVAGRNFIDTVDISSQFDGVTKTFNIPAVYTILSVDMSSYPYGAMQKATDFTFTPTTITFGDTIDAATQLEAGQKCVLTVVIG